MSWYEGYRDEWKEIIETVSRELGRQELMVEKDTMEQQLLLSRMYFFIGSRDSEYVIVSVREFCNLGFYFVG